MTSAPRWIPTTIEAAALQDDGRSCERSGQNKFASNRNFPKASVFQFSSSALHACNFSFVPEF